MQVAPEPAESRESERAAPDLRKVRREVGTAPEYSGPRRGEEGIAARDWLQSAESATAAACSPVFACPAPVESTAYFFHHGSIRGDCSNMRNCCLSLAALALAVPLTAQNSQPQPEPVPMPPPIAAPADTPYPGTITLDVNLTNTTDRVAKVHEAIPVKPGRTHAAVPGMDSRQSFAHRAHPETGGAVRQSGRQEAFRGCAIA